MDSNRHRQQREFRAKCRAEAKAEGKLQVAWLLPQDDLAIVDQIKAAHAYKKRDEAVSMVFARIRSSAKLRKEFGL